MHGAVRRWLKRTLKTLPPVSSVLDIGGRNVNGSNRDFFPNAKYKALDIVSAPGVDIVADARTWAPDGEFFDLVICISVFEHVERWQDIVTTMWLSCASGGHVLITCAGPGWGEHSADDGPLKPGEWYEEPDPAEVHAVMSKKLVDVQVEYKRRIPELFARGRRI